jgi:hypothetical protein
MPVYNIPLEYPPEYDTRQEQRDQWMERIRQSLNWHEIRLECLERICLGFLERGHTFNALLQQLEDVPIRDTFDLDSYVKYCGPRDGQKLGQALMRIAAEVCLKHVQEADDAQF